MSDFDMADSFARPGEAPHDVYRRIAERDIIPLPDDLKLNSPSVLGVNGVDRQRYFERSFAQAEVERLWPRTWQMVCREEEIPETGDVIVYDIARYSLLITRVAEDEIKAYHNSCMHRGTRLCATDTSINQFRCPFHGFTWNLDGSLKEVPCRWDFPHVSEDSHRLPEAQVDRWGGFVFINMDPDAPPLRSYMGWLVDQLNEEEFSNKYIVRYLRKVLPANWKLCIEAFMEAYHVLETHNNQISITNDANTQYDIFPDSPHISRFIEPYGVQSPHVGRIMSEQEILDDFYRITRSEQAPTLPPGLTARNFIANETRARKAAETGRDYFLNISDADAVDAMEYTLFPNLILFRGVYVPFAYRFRPNGDDPDSCIFDHITLGDIAEGQARPEAAEVFDMGDMSYSELNQMGPIFGQVYDEDTGNLGLQQQGVKSGVSQELTMARYQESRLRFFHKVLDDYIAKPPVDLADRNRRKGPHHD